MIVLALAFACLATPFPSSVPVGPNSRGSAARPIPTTPPASLASSSLLNAAASSLSRGTGPAGGTPWSCTAASTGSASCGPTTPSHPPNPAASNPGWVQPSLTPVTGGGASMVYDGLDGYVVLFGGRGTSPYRPLNATWVFQNSSWHELPTTTAPYLRAGASMVYDRLDRYVLLFGGTAGGSAGFNDTWKFAGGRWTQLSPVHAPAPRSYAAMAYDSTDRYVLLYGGCTWTCPPSTATGRHDTWAFAAGQWKNLTNYNRFLGPPRAVVAMADDRADGHVVLFASEYSGGSWTWWFKGGAWTNITSWSTTVPGGRSGAVMAQDPVGGDLVLFGGTGGTNGARNDTWRFSGGNWTQFTTPVAPSPQSGASMAYDGAAGFFVLAQSSTSLCSSVYCRLPPDTWGFSNGSWSRVRVSLQVAPGPRREAGLATYSRNGVLLFGGCGPARCPLNETWLFTAGAWTNLTPTLRTAPSPRYGMAFAGADGWAGVLLFGGTDGKHVFGDTWRFAQGTWHHLTGFPNVPSPRYGAAMAFGSYYPRMVLFGGTNGTAYFNDTWYFPISSLPQWTLQNVAHTPPARALAGLGYTQCICRYAPELTLFGGENAKGFLTDAWSYNGSDWAPDLGAGANPMPVVGEGLGYTSHLAGPRLFLFGGSNGSSYSNATWTLGNVDLWVRMFYGTHPSARTEAAMAFDPADGLMVLFGGTNASGYLGDTWALPCGAGAGC